jgi:DHA1 family inner membrane transport protein
MTLTVRSERARLWLLALLQLTLLLDFMIMMPLGPELMRALTLSPALFGGLLSSYTFASALASLTAAYWLDRFERRQVLLTLYGTFIAATLACGLSTSTLGLLSSRIVAGGTAGILSATIMALVVDSVPAPRRGDALATIMTSYAISAVLGVPLGLSIAQLGSWRATFLVLAALSLLLWFALARSLPRSASSQASDEHHAQAQVATEQASERWFLQGPLVLGWCLTFVVVFAGFLLIPYLSTFMVANLGLSSTRLPWAYLCGGALTFFTMRGTGALVDTRGAAPVLACLLVATMVPHLLFTHLERAPVWRVVGLFVLFMTLTSGRMVPTIVLLTSRVAPGLRGRFMAINTATSDLASGLAAWLSGALLGRAPDGSLVGFPRMGWLAVATSALALGLLWLVQHSHAPSYPCFRSKRRDVRDSASSRPRTNLTLSE